MQVTDITRVAEEVTSAAVSTVNDSIVSAAREGERLATRAAGWFGGLAARTSRRSRSSNRLVVALVAVTVAVALWTVVRRAQRTSQDVDGENVESFAPGDDQSSDARPARQAS